MDATQKTTADTQSGDKAQREESPDVTKQSGVGIWRASNHGGNRGATWQGLSERNREDNPNWRSRDSNSDKPNCVGSSVSQCDQRSWSNREETPEKQIWRPSFRKTSANPDEGNWRDSCRKPDLNGGIWGDASGKLDGHTDELNWRRPKDPHASFAAPQQYQGPTVRGLNKHRSPQHAVLSKGRIATISNTLGFIKGDAQLPADYSQNRDIFFYVDQVQSGHLQLQQGDRVTYSLGTKDKDRPKAFGVKLTHCKSRGSDVLTDYISQVSEKVDENLSEDIRNPTWSEYIVSVLSCQAVWECIGKNEHLESESVEKLLGLLVKLDRHSQSMSTMFHEALEALVRSPFLNPRNGCLASFVFTSFHDGDTTAVSILREFLPMLIRCLPEKTRAIVTMLKPILNTQSCGTDFLYSMLKTAAKFAANSIEDMEWDELPLVPGVSELLENELNLQPVKIRGSYDSAEEYLDVYFRLLRADCFEALSRGVKAFLNGSLDLRDMKMYHDVHLNGIQLTRQGKGLGLDLKVSHQTKDWNDLMFGNLVCISPNATFRDTIWATVVSSSYQSVTVELCSDCNSVSASEALLLLSDKNQHAVMAESPTYYRAYKPVMEALQKLEPHQLSFHEELVQAESSRAYPCFQEEDPDATFNDELLDKNGELDTSQHDAVNHALLRRFAIIQGPPGTGKTYVGVRLVQLFLSMSCIPDAPILVLTYKNHALDEFLKGLLHAGVDQIVRIGGRSKESEMDQYNMNQIKRGKKISPELFKELKSCQAQLDDVQDRVEMAFGRLDNARTFSHSILAKALNSDQLTQLLLGCDWSKTNLKQFNASRKAKSSSGPESGQDRLDRDDVEEFLDSLKTSVWNLLNTSAQYSVQSKLLLLIEEATEQWMPSESATRKVEDIMQTSVMSGNPNQLSAQSILGTVASEAEPTSEEDMDDEQMERMASTAYQMTLGEEFAGESKFIRIGKQGVHRLFGVTREAVKHAPIQILRNTADVWSLGQEDRVKLIQVLLLQQYEEPAREFETCCKEYQMLCAMKNELEIQHKAALMNEVDVIGMTITGACIHQQLLAEIKPAIVIVEEAAEVLEPQITAVLGKWVQQLILIGDHKQLRPPVESYTLRRDYNFDLSLMERLINNDFPHRTLNLQNRMRPEFAELLMDIYPQLQSNTERVGNNHKANCIKHSMYFWDHQQKEISERSFSNEEEANRAVRLALFLVQQGYKPSEITILAPYRGQVALIRKKVSSAAWDEHRELLRTYGGRVEVQTIDTYQGDENDFIIVSLVRSNSNKDTGFVKTLNRRCVAQSRAKCGMYFIGNFQTIASAHTWRPMLLQMKTDKLVGSVMPLHCHRHPESTLLAEEASDITLKSFCTEVCDTAMSCGKHRCLEPCQPEHSHVTCRIVVQFHFSTCGHPGVRECQLPEERTRCEKEVEKVLPCMHTGLVKCSAKPGMARCSEPCLKTLPCTHPCQQPCWKPCAVGDCGDCKRIELEKAQLMQKQQETNIRKVKEETENRIRELKKEIGEVCCLELLPTGDTASEYYDVEDKVKKYVQPGHKWFPSVKKIEKVSNPKQEVKWLQRKLMVNDPLHIERKFHGTTAEATASIVREGFRKPEAKGQMYGAGIYFATDSSKSAQETYTKGSDTILLCDVLLGRTKTVDCAQNGMTLQKLKSLGYDSVFAARGSRGTGGVRYDEFVVYHEDQAIPRYVIHYRKADVTDTNTASQLNQLQAKAMGDGILVCHNIKPKRELKHNDPLEIHFRIAESQVRRLQKGTLREIESVDYYINPPVVTQFNNKVAEFTNRYGTGKEADYVLAFHGTKPGNIAGIVKDNFRMDMLSRGTYGAGIYLSEFPDTSLEFGQSVMLCRVLPGKAYDCIGSMPGGGLKPGYDSHRVKADKEGRGWALVIFNPAQILPRYVINFK